MLVRQQEGIKIVIIKWDTHGSIWADMQKNLREWEVVDDDIEMMTLFNKEEISS